MSGENFWFKEALSKRHNFKTPIKYDGNDSISRIYEYCIKDIVTKQANKFYEDFMDAANFLSKVKVTSKPFSWLNIVAYS